jgi:hypothetical protein
VTGATASGENQDLFRKFSGVIAGFLGLLVFLGGLVITLIQFYYTIRYLQAIGKSDLNGVAALIPSWSRPFMVDLALVAPALVCFTGACVVHGAWGILSRKTDLDSSGSFPFPRRYRTYFVQYGLLGTVIGFVIGFSNVSAKGDQAALVMLAALSASLWSTLTAIALAYLFGPIIEMTFQKYLAPFRVVDEDPMETLRNSASDAASALRHLTASSSAADTTLVLQTVANELISVREDLAKAIGNLQSADRRISLLEVGLATSRSDVDALQHEAVTLRKEITEGDKRIREEVVQFQNRVERVERSLINGQQRLRSEMARIVETSGALVERLRKELDE